MVIEDPGASAGNRSPVQPPVEHVTILEHITAILSERDRHYQKMLQEIDLRHQQRFDAQTRALDAAFLAQQTATHAALAAAEKAVSTAMTAAEKAVAKAEVANEKRFESVNEFRGQLGDQANTFMPRTEAETRFTSIAEKIDDLRGAALRQGGRSAGLQAGWGFLLGAAALVSAVIAIASKAL